MAKGPIITPQVEAFIGTVYENHPKWKASEVCNEVRFLLHKNNPKLPSEWPSLSTVQKILATYRKPRPPNPQDKPWCLGESVKHGFPSEATSDLLELWRWCLAAGLKFTIRHAKWVCYIRNEARQWMPRHGEEFIPGILFQWCQEYSNRERICEVLGIDLDTFDLDAAVAMAPSWEWYTAYQVGALDANRIKAIPRALPDLGVPNTPSLWSLSAAAIVAKELGIDKLDGRELERLGYEPNKVYAYWLRYISKGPNWENMSPDDRLKIAEHLLDDIKTQASREEIAEHWEPTEILREVGYKDIPEGGTK